MAYKIKMRRNGIRFFLVSFLLVCCALCLAGCLFRRTDQGQGSIGGKEFENFNENYSEDFRSAELQQVLDDKVKELDVPGIQASVRVKDFYWRGASGSTDLKKREKLTAEHILRIGSVTKNFTAAVILKLHEQGKIGLDDTMNAWFPEYPRADSITIRRLLNHGSGIYNYTENLRLGAQSVLWRHKKWNPEALLKSTRNKKFYFLPGEGHYYSNTNYLILGLIIEKITGKPLSTVYREYIFEPENLSNTFFIPYEETPENLITGYDRDVIPFGTHKITPDETSFATLGFSAGAMVSTANDLRQWIDGLFKSGFLQEETLDEMMGYVEAEDHDVRGQIGYGLGLRVLHIGGDIVFGHTGTIPGFGAAVFYCPEKDYSAAVIGNASMFDQISVIEGLFLAIKK
jgi:D-alanyl-D-alanine carboxypeptidase